MNCNLSVAVVISTLLHISTEINSSCELEISPNEKWLNLKSRNWSKQQNGIVYELSMQDFSRMLMFFFWEIERQDVDSFSRETKMIVKYENSNCNRFVKNSWEFKIPLHTIKQELVVVCFISKQHHKPASHRNLWLKILQIYNKTLPVLSVVHSIILSRHFPVSRPAFIPFILWTLFPGPWSSQSAFLSPVLCLTCIIQWNILF